MKYNIPTKCLYSICSCIENQFLGAEYKVYLDTVLIECDSGDVNVEIQVLPNIMNLCNY